MWVYMECGIIYFIYLMGSNKFNEKKKHNKNVQPYSTRVQTSGESSSRSMHDSTFNTCGYLHDICAYFRKKSALELWRFAVLCITSVLSPRVQRKIITRGATLDTTNVHVVHNIRLQLTNNGFKRIAPMTGSWNDEESIEWPMDVAMMVLYLK